MSTDYDKFFYFYRMNEGNPPPPEILKNSPRHPFINFLSKMAFKTPRHNKTNETTKKQMKAVTGKIRGIKRGNKRKNKKTFKRASPFSYLQTVV